MRKPKRNAPLGPGTSLAREKGRQIELEVLRFTGFPTWVEVIVAGYPLSLGICHPLDALNESSRHESHRLNNEGFIEVLEKLFQQPFESVLRTVIPKNQMGLSQRSVATENVLGKYDLIDRTC